MKISNHTKNTTISEAAKLASNPKDRVIGLLKYEKPITLLIHTRFGIHTFGMKYPIDVIILDKKHTVVKLKRYLKPNRFFLWNPKYDTVLELPHGSIHDSKTELGDKIHFI